MTAVPSSRSSTTMRRSLRLRTRSSSASAGRRGSAKVEAIEPCIVEAVTSKRASFGSVRVTAPLTVWSSIDDPGLTAMACATRFPLTVCASSERRAPRASTLPFTVSRFKSPSRSLTITSPLTVSSVAATPGGIVTSKRALILQSSQRAERRRRARCPWSNRQRLSGHIVVIENSSPSRN